MRQIGVWGFIRVMARINPQRVARGAVRALADLTGSRLTHAQVRYEPLYVEATLRRVALRLAA